MKKKNSQLNDLKSKINKTINLLDKGKSPDSKTLIKLFQEINSLSTEPILQNEALFRTTLFSIADAVITTDNKGKIRQMNPVAEKLCGWKESEARNKPLEFVFKIINEQTRKKVKYSANNILHNGNIVKLPDHSLLITKKGKEIPIADSGAPIKNDEGEIVGVVLVFRDQSKERENQNKLSERERKYSTLISNLPGFVYRCLNDRNWTMEFISDGCKQITGYSPGDFIKNKKLAFNDIIVPAYQKSIWKKWQKTLKDKNYIELEYPIKTKNGKIKWVWERGRGIYDKNDNLIFLEGYIADVTESKSVLTEVQKSKDRMQLLVEGTPHLFFYVQNLQGLVEYISPSIENITGYTVKQWLNQKHWFVTDSPINQNAKHRTHAHLRGEVNTDPVYVEILHANGSKVMIEIYERPIIKDGNIIGLQGVAHDITERIRYENHLKESEISYRGLFNSVSDSIYIQDENGVFLDVNEGAVQMYGYDKEILIGKTPDFVSAPGKNDLEAVRLMVQKAFLGEKQRFEFWGKRKNGEEFLKDVRLYPGNYFNKKVTIAIAQDITQKKKVEQLLRESEEKYRALAENINDALYSITRYGIISYISGSIKQILGFDAHEIIGKPFISYLLKDDSAKLPEQIKKILSGTTEPIEYRLLTKSGKVHWVRSSGKAIYEDNKLVGFQGVMIDINNEKLFEEKLKESEERYRIISNLTSDYLFSTVVNKDGKNELVWIAGSFEKITGYKIDEYKKVGGWRARLHPDDLELDDLDVQKLHKNKIVVREIRTYNKIGSLVWVKSHAQPIWDEKTNKLIGIIGAVEDITKRKQTEIIQKVQYNIANATVKYKILTELFENIRLELSAIINVNNFFIALYDEKTGMLRSDVDKDEVEELSEWPAKNSMTGYVIEKQKSILIKKNEINRMIASGDAGMIGVIPEVWLGVPFKIDGKVFGVLVVQSYDDPNVYDQNILNILEGVAHELSIYIQHKNAEEETLKLSTAIVQSPISVIITKPDGTIEFVNPKFTEVTGYSLEEAKGNNPRILNSGLHTKKFYSNLWETISSGKVWQGEFQNKKKNGELYWENAIISPIINSERVTTNYVAVKEDITDKKKMIEELIIAKENAEEMNRVKSSFFANMSHELRTPMVGILGFSEILMSELKDNPDYFSMTNSIHKSGERLLETLNLILTLSKLEASKIEVNLKCQNIIPLLKESFNFFESVAATKGLSYIFDSERDEVLCEVDQFLFASVFNNLINNAIKFTDEG